MALEKNKRKKPDIKPLIAALQFLTIIPIPVMVTKTDMERSLPWFPLAGLVTGSMAAAAFLLAHLLGLPPMMAGLIAVLVLSAANGFFHLDGIADTADGFFSSRPKDRILEIMRDSRIGTMGVVGLFFILGLKWSALVAMAPGIGWRGLLIAAVVARCAQVFTLAMMPYARKEGGLASVFLKAHLPAHMATVFISGLLLSAILAGVTGILAVMASIAAALAFNFWCLKKIDGMTGDTVGATTEIVETIVLCTMAVVISGGV
jgi:adenosylcobinamide-GDP ribazoletransferase